MSRSGRVRQSRRDGGGAQGGQSRQGHLAVRRRIALPEPARTGPGGLGRGSGDPRPARRRLAAPPPSRPPVDASSGQPPDLSEDRDAIAGVRHDGARRRSE